MLIGQSLFIPATGDPGVTWYGPWMQRQGNSLTAVFQVIKASHSSGWDFTCEVETKNEEDSDASATSLGQADFSSDATEQSVEVTGCKELVRFKYTGAGGGTDRWVHFRANPIIWQPN